VKPTNHKLHGQKAPLIVALIGRLIQPIYWIWINQIYDKNVQN